jgi:hypothetical protein
MHADDDQIEHGEVPTDNAATANTRDPKKDGDHA